MKLLKAITLVAILSLGSLYAQETNEKIKIYKTWISLNSGPYKTEGVLFELKDSSIVISNSLIVKDYINDRFDLVDLNINNIETIKLRKKNSIGQGILIGAISGLVIGGIAGLISGDDGPDKWLFRLSAEEKAIVGMPIGLMGGALIGSVVGSIKVKIPIRGNIQNYHKNKLTLKKYSIMKN